MGRQHVTPAVYHHLNHDKWGWEGYGVADLTWQSYIALDFLFKVTLFSNFGLQDDLKVTISLIFHLK